MMRKKMEQHMKDVKFGRTSSATAKHVEESVHQIDWDKTLLGERKEVSKEDFRK